MGEDHPRKAFFSGLKIGFPNLDRYYFSELAELFFNEQAYLPLSKVVREVSESERVRDLDILRIQFPKIFFEESIGVDYLDK